MDSNYVFDKDNVSFKKEKPSVMKMLRKIFRLFLVSLTLAVVYYAVFALLFNTDTERRLKRENRMLETVLPQLEQKEALLADVVANLEIRDDKIYEEMFQTSSPDVDPVSSLDFLHGLDTIPDGLLAVATCPWILTNDSSAAGLDLFCLIYTAFFGPIFAVLITDYFILHKKNYTEEQLADLYNEEGNHKGVNWAAIIAIAVGAVIGLLNVDISFFTATIPTALIFYFCMKFMPSCERFRKGTTLEK